MGCIVPIFVGMILYAICAPVILTGVLLFVCISAISMIFRGGGGDDI